MTALRPIAVGCGKKGNFRFGSDLTRSPVFAECPLFAQTRRPYPSGADEKLSKKALSSTDSHLAVVRGDGKALRLLCANCSCIAIAKDTSINGNLKYCLSLKLFAADDAESEQA